MADEFDRNLLLRGGRTRMARHHPGGRVFPVAEMVHRPFITHIRDTWRPRILANAA